MGKLKHTLTDRGRPITVNKDRKTRSDKKPDYRVPISKEDYDFILYSSRCKNISMTQFATDILRTYVEQGFDFKEHPFEITGYEVHVKPEKELYQKIVELSKEWDCKGMRKIMHRVLTDSLFYTKGGVHIHGL